MILKKGSLVPAEITCDLLIKAINQNQNNRVLIDGFPRTQGNLECWNEITNMKINLELVLLLNCSIEVIIK
jgi:UMP-CMP kinase